MNMSFEQRRRMEGFLFVLPGIIVVLAVLGYPLIYNILLSLKNMNVRNITTGGQFVGFQNYIDQFQSPLFRKIFMNTVVFTVFCLIFQFTIGMLLALFFNQKSTLSGPLRGLCMVPYLMPMSVTALLFQNIFTASSGFMNDLLFKLGLISNINAIPWLTSTDLAMTAVIITNCWVGIPFNMLLLTNGLANVPQDIYESAAVDGATRVQRFFRITVPMIKPAMLSVLMMGCIYTFKCFDLMYVMTSGGPQNATDVLGTYAYQLSFSKYEFSQGSTVSVILFLVLLIVSLFYLRVINTED